jgi:dihydrofolate reductase
MKINLIVAASNNGAIGRNNELLWHLPNDLKMFKNLTTRKVIIMGRKTFDVQEAIDMVKQIDGLNETFIIGGGMIYKQALEMDIVDEIYYTKVNCVVEDADTHFEFDRDKWKLIDTDYNLKDDKHFTDYAFEKYVKEAN